MTKKLKKMMDDPKPKVRIIKERKMTKKERLAVRGIALHVGTKKTITLMAEHIKEQRLTMPVVDLSSKDPSSKFAIEMYSCIGKWDDKHLAMFIEGVTGKIPQYTEPGAMQGTIKAIFHAIFGDEATKEEVSRYDSVFKMWPSVRLKPSKKERRLEMATKKGSAKKVSTKKATAKKKGGKKAVAAGKKKAAPKKSGGGRLSPINGDTKLTKKKASCGESEAWDAVLDVMGKTAMTFDKLCEVVEKKLEGDEAYTRRVVGSLRRRDCIVAAD